MEARTVSEPKGGPEPQDIEFPLLPLRHCTTEEHCRALLDARDLPFWWQHDLSRGKNFSLPFQDSLGTWWYQVRAGFAWPVDATEAMPAASRRLPLSKTYLAYQHVVEGGEPSDSALVINMIMDLAAYGPKSISDKRRAIRKGFRCCDVVVVDKVDDGWLPGALKCWNDLVERTGWRSARDESYIRATWSRIALRFRLT